MLFTTYFDHISCLAWGCLVIAQEELEDVAMEDMMSHIQRTTEHINKIFL